MPIDTHLKESLIKMDEEFGGDNMYKMMGPTLLGYASTDSSRMYMFTSHLKQILVLQKPDVPRLSTSFENVIGKCSNAYKKVSDDNWVVKDIIRKFDNEKALMMIVLYNEKTKEYDMQEISPAESLTEKFGYLYNTDYVSSLKVGDYVNHKIPLYKSTSYDDNMNYRYGKNARVFYVNATDTLEDAMLVRRGWAKEAVSNEVDEVSVSLNDNDILLNIYGKASTNIEDYKPFPDIGEKVKDSIICATRRVNKNHLLYDFQAENLKIPYDSDVEYFVPPESFIYDINVYYNGKEEIPDNIFNRQIKYYYNKNNEYVFKINEWCDKILDNNHKHTQNVSYYKSRVGNYLNPEYSHFIKDKPFGHMVLEFKVYSDMPLEIGAKLSGRYGNKGIISKFVEDEPLSGTKITIVDDSRMPYYYDEFGEKIYVDILLSQSGAIRRLNPEQLCEVEANFIAERIQNRVKQLKTFEEKEKVIFKFLDMINTKFEVFHELYLGNDVHTTIDTYKLRIVDSTSKRNFIDSIEKNGFYLVRPPHKPLLYDDIKSLYKEFEWIKPLDLKINLFGIPDRPMLRKGIVGYQYMIVLKQNSRKSFSARSTYRVNRSNIPTKDIAKKTNKSAYAKTAVRLSEIYALFPSISGKDLAEFNIFMRSSALGRRSLRRIINAEGNPMNIHKLKVHESYTNANADIINARLKSIGLGLRFVKDTDKEIPDVYDKTIVPLSVSGYTIYDEYGNYEKYNKLFKLYNEEAKKFTMVESYHGEKSSTIWDKIFTEIDEAKQIFKELNINSKDDLDQFKQLTITGQNKSLMINDEEDD